MNTFYEYGGVDGNVIKESFIRYGFNFNVSYDLMLFWNKVGGGDFFDTESFFYPIQDLHKENVLDFNIAMWELGFPKDYLCIYSGLLGLGAISSNDYLTLFFDDNSFRVNKYITFAKLINELNEEYSDRYYGTKISW